MMGGVCGRPVGSSFLAPLYFVRVYFTCDFAVHLLFFEFQISRTRRFFVSVLYCPGGSSDVQWIVSYKKVTAHFTSNNSGGLLPFARPSWLDSGARASWPLRSSFMLYTSGQFSTSILSVPSCMACAPTGLRDPKRRQPKDLCYSLVCKKPHIHPSKQYLRPMPLLIHDSPTGDGLRADKAFQSFPDPSPDAANDTDSLSPRPLAPFLRSRVLSHGTFGVSHTRVPTESRPGHVALIAGLYEDVSAVTTGWKLNPVNFDSVFNRSRHTWSWGSPDILPMFKEGAVPGRVYAHTYGHEFEDFTQDAKMLDTWVFDKVKELFEEAGRNKTLDEELRKDKNVFFLHLLGLDTTGHAYRPYSKEYLHNIQVVDKGVQEVSELIEKFYGDDETAFVFTADHGMSDWGSHGDGHPDNTRTPLVVWGSGVAKPVMSTSGTAPGHDGFSSDWGFDNIQRNDVEQADIAALMAYLAGLDFPVNSVGELPLPYLAANSSGKANAMLVNAQEILEMYRVKEERRKAREVRYRPFAQLGDPEKSADHRVAQIQSLIRSGSYDEAISQSTELISVGLGGLRYLQTYDWLFLRTLVTAGYLGWIAFAVTTVVDLHVLHGKTDTSRSPLSTAVFASIFVALCSVLVMQQSPLSNYAYAVFPCIFWEEVFARRHALAQGRRVLFGHIKTLNGLAKLVISVLAGVALLEAVVSPVFTTTLREIPLIHRIFRCKVISIGKSTASATSLLSPGRPFTVLNS